MRIHIEKKETPEEKLKKMENALAEVQSELKRQGVVIKNPVKGGG